MLGFISNYRGMYFTFGANVVLSILMIILSIIYSYSFGILLAGISFMVSGAGMTCAKYKWLKER